MLKGNEPYVPAAASAPRISQSQARIVKSHDLLEGAREIRIAHGAETYRLTVTRQGKLILTK
jgi:hemin uptake protein HemP